MVEVYNKNLKIIATVEDLVFDNTFIREFIVNELKGNKFDKKRESLVVQYDLQNKLINLEQQLNVNFMDKIPKDLKHVSKFLTFDIETYLDKDNNSVPYACGFYDGSKTFSYYLDKSLFENSEAMLLKCLEDMLKPQYNNYRVYCHNFSKFDAMFLHRIFHKYFKVSNIISKDLNIISMNIKVVKDKSIVKLQFIDSFCILPSSLQRLGLDFKVQTTKGYFPYSFVNQDNLFYSGDMPAFTYYNNLSIEQYNQIKKTV